jgi:hypothetical protein
MCENRGLRRISEYKRHEVTGGWRKLHNEECYPNVDEAHNTHGRDAYKILV